MCAGCTSLLSSRHNIECTAHVTTETPPSLTTSVLPDGTPNPLGAVGLVVAIGLLVDVSLRNNVLHQAPTAYCQTCRRNNPALAVAEQAATLAPS